MIASKRDNKQGMTTRHDNSKVQDQARHDSSKLQQQEGVKTSKTQKQKPKNKQNNSVTRRKKP